MSSKTLASALFELGRRLPRASRIKVFGGEPLLKPGLVRQAVGLAGKLGLGATFELGTRGTLMDERMARFLCTHPEVEVVFGRPSVWARRLPWTSLNFVIAPGERAPRVLSRLRAAVALGFRRFNFLPVYYAPWSGLELAELRRSFAGLARLFRRAAASGLPLEVKNLRRQGRVPLYNDGWCVDTDGQVYASNLVLVRGAEPHAGRLRLGKIGGGARLHPFPPRPALDAMLRACFSSEALESSRHADEALSDFVHNLTDRPVGAELG
jgi:hypothetical protein